MFALIDCNNFYASCERLFRPQLRGKPIVVLSNNDGCVIARSNEAKKLGIPMGAVAFEYKDLFEKNNVHVFSSNYALYGDMSNRVMNMLAEFSPEIEVYSIDEAFLKFEGFDAFYDFNIIGKEIRYKVTKGTGIPISVGFANTKSLSKVANKIAKKFPEKTGNVYVIDTEEKRIKALKWLPIEDVWGIGRQHAKRLQAIGVKNAYQFTQLQAEWVKKNMSIVGLRLYNELLGIPCLELDDPLTDKKNIACTRSFDKNYDDYNYIRERVSSFAVNCAEKLRKQNSYCNAMMVFLLTNYHRKDHEQYSKNILLKLPYPTNSNIELSRFATNALSKIYKKGYLFKKAGVIVMEITPESQKQLNMFENSNPKHISLMKAIDDLNKIIGVTKVKLASQDIGRAWKMKQEKLSPRYTTRIDELLMIKA